MDQLGSGQQDWLWNGGGFAASEVDADGNCALWSLLSLKHGDPFLVHEKHAEECKELRLLIASHWPHVSDSRLWQFLFTKLLTIPLNQPQAPSVEVKSGPVSEPVSMPKYQKRKAAAQDLPQADSSDDENDLLSSMIPPAPQKGVSVVGAARPACKPKKSAASPFEVPPMAAEAPSEKQTLREKLQSVPDLDGSPRKAKRKRRKKSTAEGDGQPAEEDSKKGRKRTCKKKQETEDHRKLDAVHSYLASKEIDFLKCQRYHSVSGGGKCKQFAKWPQQFLEGQMPECTLCVSMLKHHGFVLEELQSLVKEAAENVGFSASKMRWKELQKQLEEDTEAKPAPPPEVSPDDGPDQPAEKPETDGVMELLLQNPFLRMEPLGTCQKRVPIRCLACKTAKQPKGKVFEGHSATSATTLNNFIEQHCVRQGHLTNLAAWVRRRKLPEEEVKQSQPERQQLTACEGLSLTNMEPRLQPFRMELLEWAGLNKLSSAFGRHRYKLDNAAEDLTVFHEECEKIIPKRADHVPGGVGENAQHRPICEKCRDWRLGSPALASAIRFSIKYWAVKLLQAKLFKSEEVVQSMIEDMKGRSLYKLHPSKVDEVLGWNLPKLQQQMRKSWLKVRRDSFTPQLHRFMEDTVRCSAE